MTPLESYARFQSQGFDVIPKSRTASASPAPLSSFVSSPSKSLFSFSYVRIIKAVLHRPWKNLTSGFYFRAAFRS